MTGKKIFGLLARQGKSFLLVPVTLPFLSKGAKIFEKKGPTILAVTLLLKLISKVFKGEMLFWPQLSTLDKMF